MTLALTGAGVFIRHSLIEQGKALGQLSCAETKTEVIKNEATRILNRPHSDDDVTDRLQAWGDRIRAAESDAK